MPQKIILLICSLSAVHIALILYSIGILSFYRSKVLTRRHLWYFWIGFIFDLIATGFMTMLAGRLIYNLHTLLGFGALFFMLLHAIGATIILRKSDTQIMQKYRIISLLAWTLWIISYLSGMFIFHH